MAFNHYAKLQRIIALQDSGWYIARIDQPTSTLNFKGERVQYEYYYRLYTADGQAIKYGKFQKLDKLASVLRLPVEALPVREHPSESS